MKKEQSSILTPNNKLVGVKTTKEEPKLPKPTGWRLLVLPFKIKFATPADARATVAKVKRVNKPFARKIQILTVMEQRAKVMGKSQVASIAKKGKDAIRKRHNKTN